MMTAISLLVVREAEEPNFTQDQSVIPSASSGTPKRKRRSTCAALVGAFAQYTWRSRTRSQTPPPHLDSHSPPRTLPTQSIADVGARTLTGLVWQWTPFGCVARQWDSLHDGLFGKQILWNIGYVASSDLHGPSRDATQARRFLEPPRATSSWRHPT